MNPLIRAEALLSRLKTRAYDQIMDSQSIEEQDKRLNQFLTDNGVSEKENGVSVDGLGSALWTNASVPANYQKENSRFGNE